MRMREEEERGRVRKREEDNLSFCFLFLEMRLCMMEAKGSDFIARPIIRRDKTDICLPKPKLV